MTSATVRKPRRTLGTSTKINWSGITVVVIVLVVWQLLGNFGPLREVASLPTPLEIFGGLMELVESGRLVKDTLYTVFVVLVSSFIGIISGTTLGLAIGLVRWFDVFFSSTFDVLRTIPIVALMPVALLLWGAEARTEIIIASVAATWPMLVNAAGGIRTVHPRLHEVGRMFRFSKWRTLTRLLIPAAMPQLLVGGRLAVVTSLVAAIVAEMIISPSGLGWALMETQYALQTAQMWAVVLVSGIFGYVLNMVLTYGIERIHGSRKTAV